MEEFLQKIEPLHMSYNSDYWIILRAYMNSLSDKELLDIYIQKFSDNDIVKSLLQNRDIKSLGTILHKTIVKLIDGINRNGSVAKKTPGYVALRRELQLRYQFASQNDKRNILDLFLNGNKTERIWVYTCLYECWDNYFFDKIKSVYEQYQDGQCLKVFINHFPKSYLIDKFDALVNYYNYSYACYCLGVEYMGYIDKSKMSLVDYLQLMASLKRKISRDEAEDILYLALVESLYPFLYYYDSNKRPTILSIDVIKSIVRSMGTLGMKESLMAFASICYQANEILDTNSPNIKRECNRIYDEILSLLPPKYRTTNADEELKKVLANRSYSINPEDDPF